MLTAARLRELFDYDAASGDLVRRTAAGGKPAGTRAGTPFGTATTGEYMRIGVDGKSYLAHRLVWLHVYGQWPAEILDHIDGDGTNNRLANLREATLRQNAQNRRHQKATEAPYKGIARVMRSTRWQAQIWVNGRNKHLGCFDTPEAAHAAYAAAAEMHFGAFARTA